MYCRNCGRQLPDGVRFCTGCGARADGGTANVQTQSMGKTPKGGLWKTLAVMVVCAAFVCMISVVGEKTKLPSIEDDGVTSAAYTSAFSQYFLMPPVTAFPSSDSAHYVKDVSDGLGMLDNMEFAYKDGIVTAICEKMYVKVTDLDEATKSLLHESMMASFAPFDAMDNCTVQYELGSTSYIYTITTTELDDPIKLQQSARVGVITLEGDENTEYLGIQKTENYLLSMGYIKR